MRGEACAAMQSHHYRIFYSSEMMVSVAMPSTIDGEEPNYNYVADYFERAEIPFRENPF